MASSFSKKPEYYGLLAEFTTPQKLLEAVHKVKDERYSSIDAFMPYPVEEISHEICHHQKSKVSKIVALRAISSGVCRWLMATSGQNLETRSFTSGSTRRLNISAQAMNGQTRERAATGNPGGTAMQQKTCATSSLWAKTTFPFIPSDFP